MNNNEALRILQERYVKGEITDEEYLTKKNNLGPVNTYHHNHKNILIAILLVFGLFIGIRSFFGFSHMSRLQNDNFSRPMMQDRPMMQNKKFNDNFGGCQNNYRFEDGFKIEKKD